MALSWHPFVLACDRRSRPSSRATPPCQFFATKTDASALRMLNGSPAERLLKPITDYIEAK